ncbi:hypothetical protein IMZ16_05795 [Cruoricaptor ignavus]|uniref:ABC transporter ATPase n=1 Tax=Cruoricaptor ignavus TaxID=1118202 RepID=A0A7M1SZS1_9FLAO|nr:hypothetical protein [Cruoricaptor ignavus]QOR73059.1 hypothetical protein IMZ16_05795 [Cruoricaptor ignavus]
MKINESEIIETNDYRVIIYPASRPFSAKESKAVSERLFDFLSNWKAHGKPLSSSFKFERNQFIIITVDEDAEPASGCSMDALNGVMCELDAKFQLGFFDRMKASYLENGEVKTMPLADFRNAVKNGEISKEVQVFDFSKNTFVAFLSDFLLPLERSWAGQYLR